MQSLVPLTSCLLGLLILEAAQAAGREAETRERPGPVPHGTRLTRAQHTKSEKNALVMKSQSTLARSASEGKRVSKKQRRTALGSHARDSEQIATTVVS